MNVSSLNISRVQRKTHRLRKSTSGCALQISSSTNFVTAAKPQFKHLFSCAWLQFKKWATMVDDINVSKSCHFCSTSEFVLLDIQHWTVSLDYQSLTSHTVRAIEIFFFIIIFYLKKKKKRKEKKKKICLDGVALFRPRYSRLRR